MGLFPQIHPDRLAPGAFQFPVPLPGPKPGEDPLVQVCFNESWLPYILGCLTQLCLNSTWQGSQADINNALQEANNLILIFQLSTPGCKTSNIGKAGAEDGYMLRQNPDNPCELQSSVDGVTWCTWADISKCNPQVTQPGDGTPQPAAGGGCQTYHAVLAADQKWLLPAPVNSGDVITVSNAKGAWNDGTVSPWQCPDGNTFFAGACLGVGGGTSGGDPAPALNHMSLIAGIGATYFGVLASPVTIPGGVSFGMLEFQANDSILTDNLGSIEFDVQICNNQATGWTHEFDFVTSAGGWIGLPEGGTCEAKPGAVYTPGLGWTQAFIKCAGGLENYENSDIQRTFPARTITQIQVFFTVSLGTTFNSGDQDAIRGTHTGTQQFTQHVDYRTPPTSPWIWSGSSLLDQINIEVIAGVTNVLNADPGGTAHITKVVVSGTGTDPF